MDEQIRLLRSIRKASLWTAVSAVFLALAVGAAVVLAVLLLLLGLAGAAEFAAALDQAIATGGGE